MTIGTEFMFAWLASSFCCLNSHFSRLRYDFMVKTKRAIKWQAHNSQEYTLCSTKVEASIVAIDTEILTTQLVASITLYCHFSIKFVQFLCVVSWVIMDSNLSGFAWNMKLWWCFMVYRVVLELYLSTSTKINGTFVCLLSRCDTS